MSLSKMKKNTSLTHFSVCLLLSEKFITRVVLSSKPVAMGHLVWSLFIWTRFSTPLNAAKGFLTIYTFGRKNHKKEKNLAKKKHTHIHSFTFQPSSLHNILAKLFSLWFSAIGAVVQAFKLLSRVFLLFTLSYIFVFIFHFV